MTIFFPLLFFYFSQADFYGEFILINEIGSFIPPKTSFFSSLDRKKNLLFWENQNKIILYSEGVFRPLIFDVQGNYLGYLETPFYYAKRINYKKKEMIVIPFGNVLEFYILKNKTLSSYQRLLVNEYIEDFNFLKKGEDSLLIFLSCSDKEDKIKIYNQNFKLVTEKVTKGKFFIENLLDTFIFGIEKNFKKIVLWDRDLKTLWELELKDLLITDYAVAESILLITTSSNDQKKGIIYFLSIKNGKILETFPPDSFYSSGFKSLKVSDIDNDGEEEIIASTGGKKGEVLILKRAKGKWILKKKRFFSPLLPSINIINVLILGIDDFIYDKNKNKELLLLVNYEQKNQNFLFNNFISGQIFLLDNKLKDIADLDLNSPLKDYLIVNKKNKKEMVLVLLSDKLRFYE